MARDGSDWQTALGLLVLRFGLAWFLLVWAINKLLAPNQYQNMWKFMHGIELANQLPYILGALQIGLCAAMFLGLWRPVTYAVAALIHTVSVSAIFERLIEPFVINDKGFPVNRNATVALAALAAFIALWLLRRHDSWSLDAWLQKRGQSTA